ncbi:MAG: hypothetical protein ACMZ7B_08080 [Balneola sp.]
MIKTFIRYSLGLISLLITVVQTCEDIPPFDYPSNPEQSFDFVHLDLDVRLEPELDLARGVVTYTVIPKIDGLMELILFTEESAIDGVTINREEAVYELEEMKLIVTLPDSSVKGQEFDLAITWQSNSHFGLYKDFKGNFWSSKNPLAHRHWFPVFDHPRNELTFDAHISIPYEYEVLFNGEFVNDEAQTGNRKRIHYSSKTKVPVSGLGFAMGEFLISEVTSGLTTIRLFSSDQSFNEEERIALIREASQLKKDVEKVLSMEYPWEGLNIVILPDNFWEERTHGSGTIFLYENLGSLSNQLKRGVYAQWFGEYLRGEQFFDLDHAGDELLRTAVHFSLNNEPAVIENSDTLNTVYSWNHWQKAFRSESELFQKTVTNSLPGIIRSKQGIVDFDDYADIWYNETGVSWHDISPEKNIPGEEEVSDETRYAVDAQFDEMNSILNLIFELASGSGEALYSLNMMEFSFDDSTSHEVNFTGEIDTVSIQLSPSVEYIVFEAGSVSRKQVEVREMPLFFLLNQLRSSDAENRKKAASLLSGYSDNPDLQLALNDVMTSEENPEVQATLLSTMAKITDGATGTEQQFINALNSGNTEITKASLAALTNYPENEMVKNSIRNTILRSQSEGVFEAGLESYAVVATADDLVSLARRLQRVDSTGSRSLTVMHAFPEADSADTFALMAEGYLVDSNPYAIRKKALEFLLVNDSSQENWIERFDILLEDRDPRIRHASLKAIKWLSPSEALKILSSVERDEFDARVLLEVDNLLEQISE